MESTAITEATTPPTRASRWTSRGQIRGSSLLLFGKLPTKGINFAVQVLIVHYLTKGDYGAFAYALSIVTLVQTIVTFGLDRAVTRYLPIYHEQQDYARMLGTGLLVVGTILGLSGLLILAAFAGRGLIGETLGFDSRSLSLLTVLVFLGPLQALDEVLIGLLAVFGAARQVFFRKHVLAPLLKLAAVLLVMAGGWSVFLLAGGYLLATALGTLIAAGAFMRVLRDEGVSGNLGVQPPVVPAREIFAFTIPLLTTDLLYVAIYTMDAVMLQYFGDMADVAALRAVQPAALMNQLVMASFGVLFTPMAARLFARGDREGINRHYWQTAVWVAVLSLPIFLLTFACAGPLTVLLYGARYEQSALILALLSLGYYFNAALGFNGTTLKVYGKVKFIVGINLVAALVNLGANFALIPRYGAVGAAIGTCGTLVVHNLLKQAGLRLATGIDVFDRRYVRVYLVILIAVLAAVVPHLVWSVPLLYSAPLLALLALAVIRFTRTALDVEDVFPELLRVPLVRHILGKQGGR